jgi:hypothetical protein
MKGTKYFVSLQAVVGQTEEYNFVFNLLAPDFYISLLAHSICKIGIKKKKKKVAL